MFSDITCETLVWIATAVAVVALIVCVVMGWYGYHTLQQWTTHRVGFEDKYTREMGECYRILEWLSMHVRQLGMYIMPPPVPNMPNMPNMHTPPIPTSQPTKATLEPIAEEDEDHEPKDIDSTSSISSCDSTEDIAQPN